MMISSFQAIFTGLLWDNGKEMDIYEKGRNEWESIDLDGHGYPG